MAVVVVVLLVIVLVRLVKVNSAVVESIEGVDLACFEEVLDAPGYNSKIVVSELKWLLVLGVTLAGGDLCQLEKKREGKIA